MKTPTALATKILNQWRSDPAWSTTILSQDVQQRLAEQAAEIAQQEIEQRTALQASSNKVVDPVTGLELPPPARKPYQERGRGENGKRLTVFEHLRDQYADYLDAGLLFSGHLLEVDKSAYQALQYLARKELKDKGLPTKFGNPDLYLRHGILSGDHLTNIPDGFEHQIRLIKQLHAKKTEAGLLK